MPSARTSKNQPLDVECCKRNAVQNASNYIPMSQRVKLLVISILSHRHNAAVTPDIVAPALLEYT